MSNWRCDNLTCHVWVKLRFLKAFTLMLIGFILGLFSFCFQKQLRCIDDIEANKLQSRRS